MLEQLGHEPAEAESGLFDGVGILDGLGAGFQEKGRAGKAGGELIRGDDLRHIAAGHEDYDTLGAGFGNDCQRNRRDALDRRFFSLAVVRRAVDDHEARQMLPADFFGGACLAANLETQGAGGMNQNFG